ncbi:MAG: MFS transporter [Longimicrobiales bacterium]
MLPRLHAHRRRRPHARGSPTAERRSRRLKHLLAGNVLWLSIISLLNDAASEMIYPLLPLFIVGTLGAGPAVLGLIEGVAETTSSLIKLLGGWLSDRFHRRKPLVVGGYGAAAIARPLIAAATAPWHVLAIRFADRVGKGVRTAPRDALLAESVPAARRGTAFGVHRAADHAGAVIGPLLASAFLLLYPGQLRPLFAVALVPGLIAVGIAVWKVREVSDVTADHAAPSPAPAPAPAPAPGFSRFLFVLVIFTLGNASDAFLLLRAQQLGVATALIPLLWAALHVSKMAFNVVGGALSDRIGARPVIIGGWCVYALVYLGFATADQAWMAWVLFLVYGLYYGMTEAPEKALVAAFAPAGRRATRFGAYHMAVGLAALPASLIFGVLWQWAGAAAAFGFGAVLAFLAAAFLTLLVPAPPRPAFA